AVVERAGAGRGVWADGVDDLRVEVGGVADRGSGSSAEPVDRPRRGQRVPLTQQRRGLGVEDQLMPGPAFGIDVGDADPGTANRAAAPAEQLDSVTLSRQLVEGGAQVRGEVGLAQQAADSVEDLDLASLTVLPPASTCFDRLAKRRWIARQISG